MNFERNKDTASNETLFLLDVFNYLGKACIDYCILRNYEGLPYDLKGSDIDMLVHKESIDKVLEILSLLTKKHKGFTIWRQWNDYMWVIRCTGKTDNDSIWGVHFDIVTAFRFKGRDYFPIEQVLSRSSEMNGVRIADSRDASFISFIDKLLITEALDIAVLREAASAYEQYYERALEELSNIFGKDLKHLEELLLTQDQKKIKIIAKKLQRRIIVYKTLKSPIQVTKNKIKRFYAHFNRIFRRSGIFVAVIGLDGSGKSTLVNQVSLEFNRIAHVRSELRHVRPHLLPPLARLFRKNIDQTITLNNPHLEPASGMVGSILRMSYYLFDYLIGYFLSIYPSLIKMPTVAFFDRYFYDYLIDPLRYRVNLSRGIISFFLFFVPEPDVIFLLDIDPQSARIRKPELPLEDFQQHSENLQIFARKFKKVTWIDTSCKLETSIHEILWSVLESFRKLPGWHH